MAGGGTGLAAGRAPVQGAGAGCGRGRGESAVQESPDAPQTAPVAAMMAAFFIQPVAFGAWLPRIPDVRDALALSPSGLALCLLGMPVGILIALPLAGRLVARLGAGRSMRLLFPAFLALVAGPAFASGPGLLFATLLLMGTTMAVLELALNVGADGIERTSGRLIMARCHGFWSTGLMTGSTLGAGLAATGMTPGPAVLLVAATVALPSLWLAARLGPLLPQRPGAAPSARWQWPGTALLAIGAFVFGIAMTEGAAADWAALYLRDLFGLGKGAAGLGFTGFALMVAAGRLAGDAARHRLGPVRLAQLCGVTALGALLLLVTAPSPAPAFLALAALGLGASVGFPLAVTAAAGLPTGQSGGGTETAVAFVSLMGLAGFLAGPVLIGFVAEAQGLRLGLATLLGPLTLSLTLTGALRGPKPTTG